MAIWERYALRALRVEECARAARERWKWIFVDEYQDTSEIQEAILSALVGQGNAFFVGDVKQSIYRFRMAEPELFLRRQARYARGEGGRLIALTANFRSSDGIVDFVNAVFERALRGGADEIAYTGDERLRAARAFAGERVELHILSPEKDIHETGRGRRGRKRGRTAFRRAGRGSVDRRAHPQPDGGRPHPALSRHRGAHAREAECARAHGARAGGRGHSRVRGRGGRLYGRL